VASGRAGAHSLDTVWGGTQGGPVHVAGPGDTVDRSYRATQAGGGRRKQGQAHTGLP